MWIFMKKSRFFSYLYKIDRLLHNSSKSNLSILASSRSTEKNVVVHLGISDDAFFPNIFVVWS